jgi:hypothetical protein
MSKTQVHEMARNEAPILAVLYRVPFVTAELANLVAAGGQQRADGQ